MVQKRDFSVQFEKLRQQAEELIDKQPESQPDTPSDFFDLLHELQVHQVELEIQNDELKQAQQELFETRLEFENLYEFAPCGYLTLNPKGIITRANLTAVSLLNTNRSFLYRSTLSNHIAAGWETAFLKAREEAAQTGHQQVVELPLKSEDASPRWVRATLQAISNTEGAVAQWRVVLDDITERKQAEEERDFLQQKRNQQKKAESLSRMAGAVAHHFNNQMSVVMGNLAMAIEDLSPESSRIAEALEDALDGAKRASEVSSLLLSYLGQSAGKRELLDLADSCREFLPSLESLLPDQARLETDFPETGPAIKANHAQIQQLLKNCVLNAAEALEDQSGLVSLRITTASAEDIPSSHRWPLNFEATAPAYACLEVEDSGCGLTPETIDKLFDPFFTTKFIGRGLGLPVVLGSVQAHEGCIAVESVPGRGTVFQLYLPLADADAAPPPPPSHTNQDAFQGLGTVLLIDDEPTVRKMGRLMLSRLGLEVLEAQDGVEGLDLFQKHSQSIRLVLSDLTMPRMNGWETLEALRRIQPDILVILASGYDQARVMEGAGSQLPQAFLYKPFSVESLKEALAKAMQKAGQALTYA